MGDASEADGVPCATAVLQEAGAGACRVGGAVKSVAPLEEKLS